MITLLWEELILSINNMSPYLVLVTIVFYFIALYAISYTVSRKTDSRDFFVGNRATPWYVVAYAMIGSSISGVTFISVPGWVATSNFSYLQMVLGFLAGQLIIAYVLIPLFYKMNLISIYQYLENRFGITTYKTGAWFFFISKMLGASVRLFLVCAVLQYLVFIPLNIPFIFNVIFTILLVWIYTFKGGVKTLIWTDILKTTCLLFTVIFTIYFIVNDLQLDFSTMVSTVVDNPYSRTFFFDDVNDKRYFFKMFFAGMFTVIAMTGLDQDMMQRNLSCKDYKDSQKNMITSGVSQIFIIGLFLVLGVLLYTYSSQRCLAIPAKSDELFSMVATQRTIPSIVGIMFVLGLISSAYSAAGSALTALTTSFCVDIIGVSKSTPEISTNVIRKRVHIGMCIVMGIVILLFNLLNNSSVVDSVYILASYTYGPILGLFVFGLFTKYKVRDNYVPFISILSPFLCFLLQKKSHEWFNGYTMSYELLIVNAFITIICLCLLIKKK